MNTSPKTAVLQPFETVVVPATQTPHIIRDFFTKMTNVKLGRVSLEFKARFFDKKEKPAPEVTYRKYKLLGIVPDGPIIEELGGNAKAEGTVTAALTIVQRQGNGEAGILQTSGYANIFYAKDKQGELCAIRISWASDGWWIDAISVGDPFAWNGKHEIFCPVSGVEKP
jgi:hypothetical protein